MREPMTPEMLRALVGISRLPVPTDRDALSAAIERHYPAELRARGTAGFALVEASIDEEGIVRDVDVVTPPSSTGSTRAAKMVRRADGSEA